MARQDFINQLKALGYPVEDIGQDRAVLPYKIPVGRFLGKEIMLGFEVHDDFPANCPSGRHIKAKLLPNKSGGQHPDGGISDSEKFGSEWQYWSRPFEGWDKGERTAKRYMEHIRRLFDQ